MAKVLITGSAGFIGGYVVEELLNRGHQVVGVDNYSKYGPVARSYDSHPDYQFVEGDARDVDLMTKLLSDCDHLIAGAALIGGISYFHTYAYDLLATNERIIASTCDAAIAAHRDGNLQKVTYLSSSMVFESTERWPSVEGDERAVPPPLSSYGFQKLAVEYFAHAAWDQYHLPFTYDVAKRIPATDKARDVLGFEATTTLDQMLDEVIPWIEQAVADGTI